MSVSFQGDELGPGVQHDRRVVFTPANEVPRHRVCQAARADQHVHALGSLGQEYRSLTSGIAAADHDDLIAAT
jgi:tRNA U38,U39,U40 pseudouridine synthase TruA